ncbi:MAG: transposase DNA-binding-containing protein [Alphaproteobacteria bacterium]|nr:transposase DNA-binding-containing protein [Alphaproteobacteria bacterium]
MPLEPGEDLNATEWATNEFGGAPLGDERLSARLVKRAGLLAACPEGKIKARNSSGGRKTTGTKQTGAKSLGLSMHATLAVTATGLPLGALDLNFGAVACGPETRRQRRRWLDGFTDVAQAAREVTVTTATEAAGGGYCPQRWRIEDFFRALRSGCRVEHLLFRTAERLQRAIAINAVISWRIMVMTLPGRQVPVCGPQMMFADHELDLLHDRASEQGLRDPDRLDDAVAPVAHLGGCRDRTRDPDPGHRIMGSDPPHQCLAGPPDRVHGRPERRIEAEHVARCSVHA